MDFEKIRILRELASKSNDRKVKTLAAQLDEHLTTFIGDKDYSKRDYNAPAMTDAVGRGKKMLDELSVLLSTP